MRMVTMIAGAALTILAADASAQQDRVVRVSGEVTDSSYAALETFLFDAMDRVVGMRVSFERDVGHKHGQISADARGGKFVAYLAGPESASEIVADDGYSLQHGSYVFDGFFIVRSGGVHQGVVSLFLEKADEGAALLSGKLIDDIRVGDLPNSD